MQSNSKLDSEQKDVLRDMRNDQPMINVATNMVDTVIVYEFRGGLVHFATSIKSDDEMKFRFKVGEYHARVRLAYEGEFAMLKSEDFQEFLEHFEMHSRQYWRDCE